MSNPYLSLISTLMLAVLAAATLAADEQPRSETTDQEQKYALLARLSIAAESLPEGCTALDIPPEQLPIQGVVLQSIVTEPAAFFVVDKEITRLVKDNVEAMYFAVYREQAELGVMGWAFKTPESAKDAFSYVMEKREGRFRLWQHDEYLVCLWRDLGTTDRCFSQFAALIDTVMQPAISYFEKSMIATELLRTPPNLFKRNTFSLYVKPGREDLSITAKCYLWEGREHVGRFSLQRVDNELGRITSDKDAGRLLFRVECLGDPFIGESYIHLSVTDNRTGEILPGVKIALKHAAHRNGR